MADQSKYCAGCKTTKFVEGFGKNASKPSGLQCFCKSCRTKRDSRCKDVLALARKKESSQKRKNARSLGLVRYTTGEPCSKGHIAERHVSSAQCVKCSIAATVAWQKRNPERVKAWTDTSRARYVAENRQKVSGHKKAYKERHPERIKAGAEAYYLKNKERIAKVKADWLAENPGAMARWQRTRQARQLSAMPSWANEDELVAVYEEAARKTVETGIKHSVDHYYPLQGKTVCGLHVANNLRVIPLVENLKKGRRMPSD